MFAFPYVLKWNVHIYLEACCVTFGKGRAKFHITTAYSQQPIKMLFSIEKCHSFTVCVCVCVCVCVFRMWAGPECWPSCDREAGDLHL